MTITRQGDRLFAQATGQPKAEILPEGEPEFFYEVVDAQVTFETDISGRRLALLCTRTVWGSKRSPSIESVLYPRRHFTGWKPTIRVARATPRSTFTCHLRLSEMSMGILV